MKSTLPSTIVRNFTGLDKPVPLKPKFSLQELIDISRTLSLGPKNCWQVLKYDSKNYQDVFEHYVFFLAAIPSVCGFIGHGLFGSTPLHIAFLKASIGYCVSVLFFFSAVFIARRTAPMFDGEISFERAAKLVVYSLMPFFFFGSALLLPGLSPLSLAGIVSVFYFLMGIREMSRIPVKKQLTYGMLNVVTWIIAADTILRILFPR